LGKGALAPAKMHRLTDDPRVAGSAWHFRENIARVGVNYHFN
jgi:hypothetical protein